MARWAVAAWNFATRHPVVDVPPMIGRDIARVDARRLNCIDQAEDLRDFRPAMNAEQQLTAGAHKDKRLIGFSRANGAHDIETRYHRLRTLGNFLDQTKNCISFETNQTSLTIKNCLFKNFTKPKLMFDYMHLRDQIDVG